MSQLLQHDMNDTSSFFDVHVNGRNDVLQFQYDSKQIILFVKYFVILMLHFDDFLSNDDSSD